MSNHVALFVSCQYLTLKLFVLRLINVSTDQVLTLICYIGCYINRNVYNCKALYTAFAHSPVCGIVEVFSSVIFITWQSMFNVQKGNVGPYGPLLNRYVTSQCVWFYKTLMMVSIISLFVELKQLTSTYIVHWLPMHNPKVLQLMSLLTNH